MPENDERFLSISELDIMEDFEKEIMYKKLLKEDFDEENDLEVEADKENEFKTKISGDEKDKIILTGYNKKEIDEWFENLDDI